MHELILLILFCFIILNYILYRDTAYPPFIYSILWFFLLFIHYLTSKFQIIEIYELSNFVLILFTLGVFFFSLGGGIIYFFKPNFNEKVELKKDDIVKTVYINTLYDKLLFIIPIIVLPFFINRAITIASSSGIESFFLGLRNELVNNSQEGYGVLKYFILIAIFNVLIRFLFLDSLDSKSYRVKFYISLFIAFIYTILSSGRTFVLQLLVFIFAIGLIRKQIKVRHIIYVSLFFLAIFSSFSILMKKGGSVDLSISDNISGVFNIFMNYLLGAFNAFDKFINENFELLFGDNTFRTINAVLFKLNFIKSEQVALVQPFVQVPFTTNVYTVYHNYVNDFGILYSLIMISFFGFVHTYFFLRSRLYKDKLSIIFYSYLLYPLLMSFFQDQYFSLMSMWIQYISITLITLFFFIQIKNSTIIKK